MNSSAPVLLSEAYHPSRNAENTAIRDVIVNSPAGTARLYQQARFAEVDQGQMLGAIRALHSTGYQPLTYCYGGCQRRCQGRCIDFK